MNWFSQRLRNQSSGILKLPGAFDALSARFIRSEGYEAVYCGGFATVASQFGIRDNGSIGAYELAAAFGRVKQANPDMPLLVDGDTGHGGIDQVKETVKLFAAENVDAIHIEDQTNPKRCGLSGLPHVEPLEIAVERVVTAKQAAESYNIALIARTDCLGSAGLQHAIKRCNDFSNAGADAVWINGLRPNDCTPDLIKAVDGPLLLNLGSEQLTDDDTISMLACAGVAGVLAPAHALLSASAAIRASYQLSSKSEAGTMITADELNTYLNESAYEQH